MQLPPRLCLALMRYSFWRKANARKLLKEMPVTYLLLMAALSYAMIKLMHTGLNQASDVFIEQVVPTVPWQVSVILGLWLLTLWAVMGVAALLLATHGKALGERLFNAPKK